MKWKALLTVGTILVLMGLGLSIWGVYGQDLASQVEEQPIITMASRIVGIGSYVAAEAYAVPAGENPEEQPVQAFIFPYGITPNMHVMTIDEFEQPELAVEGFTFEWSLEAPDESSAELVTGTVAVWLADVDGLYTLTLTATDENGNSGSVSWEVNATTYQGSGYLEGPSTEETQCIDCHEERVAEWAETGHADMFIRAIDGVLSDHYSADCITCHTTGFNNRPEAVNGGFDDIAAEQGWVFPDELTEGNWDAMVEQFPDVAGLANIQCESCHGPGYLHVFEGGRRDQLINRSLDFGTCATCHSEEPYHVFPDQWELSGHADKNARAFWYPIGEDRTSCVRCHSGAGYIDFTQGVPEDESRFDYQVITCAVCHDPHSVDNPNQLRTFDSVVLPDGTEVTSAGPAATCMTCHNARTNPVASVAGTIESGRMGLPHHSNAAELMNNVGGFTWGETLPVSTHGRVVDETCISCHMGPTPGMDNMGTPDDNSDDQPLPGRNTVGEHTFAMVSPVDDTENVAVCQECHDGATNFEFEARRDYDGDGAVETNQEEFAGLQELVAQALSDAGVTLIESRPYFEYPEGTLTEDNVGAAYNLYFSEASGSSVHNFRYMISLLQLSYQQVAGEPVPNATILEPK